MKGSIMDLKKILLSGLMISGLALSASAVSFDFALGAGGGFQSNILKEEYYQPPKNSRARVSELNWNTGGFVGFGLGFGERISSSVGLEWTGLYQSSKVETKSGRIKEKTYFDSFNQFGDIYYRLGLNIIPFLPMGLQLNVGMAYRMMLSSTDIFKDRRERTKEIETINYNKGDSLNAFGVHVGARAHVSAFFIGVDYAYFPRYIEKEKGFRDLKLNTSDKRVEFAGNQVSFTMGLTLNRKILGL